MSDEDQRWLDGIAGRASADKEAAALREALLQRSGGEGFTPIELDEGAERLLFRLRGEGLLEKRRAMPRWAPLAIAAGLILAVGVALWPVLYRPAETDDISVRGLPPQELIHADPRTYAQGLLADLAAIDLTPVQRPMGKGLIIEAPIGNRDDPRLVATLDRHGLKVPKSGPLLVYIGPARR